LIPSLAKAVDFETHVKDLKDAAGEYKNLQDRFRQLAKIDAQGDALAAQARLSELMDRIDSIRAKSIVVPTKYYDDAVAKIKKGDYDFSIDSSLRDAAVKGGAEPMPSRT
jgi:hypothetical protein